MPLSRAAQRVAIPVKQVERVEPEKRAEHVRRAPIASDALKTLHGLDAQDRIGRLVAAVRSIGVRGHGGGTPALCSLEQDAGNAQFGKPTGCADGRCGGPWSEGEPSRGCLKETASVYGQYRRRVGTCDRIEGALGTLNVTTQRVVSQLQFGLALRVG
jgi:hypothetical protein